MEINIFNILAAVFFCLGGAGLLILGYREAPGSKNKRKLYVVGCLLFSISVFTVSRIVSTPVLDDILTGVSIVSIVLIFGYGTGYIITEHRRSR